MYMYNDVDDEDNPRQVHDGDPRPPISSLHPSFNILHANLHMDQVYNISAVNHTTTQMCGLSHIDPANISLGTPSDTYWVLRNTLLSRHADDDIIYK